MPKHRLIFRLRKFLTHDALKVDQYVRINAAMAAIQLRSAHTGEIPNFKLPKTQFRSLEKPKLSKSFKKPRPVDEEILFLDELPSKSNLNLTQENLLAYIDVCVSINEKEMAYDALKRYHDMYNGCEIPLNDLNVYNRLLEGCAADGSWEMCENIAEMMNNVQKNLQTFVFRIECAYRAKKNDVIEGILREIEENDFDIRNVLNECYCVNDRKEIVMKAIRSQIPAFEPRKRNLQSGYVCNLLKIDENKENEVVYNPLGSQDVRMKLKELARNEIEAEIKGFRTCSRIDHTPEFLAKNEKIINKLKQFELQWKNELLLTFQDKIDKLHTKTHKNKGKMSLLPYLTCLNPSEFVDLMFDNFLQIVFFNSTLEISKMHEKIGLTVMDKYMLQNKLRSSNFDQVVKLYEEYCDYFVDTELTSKYSAREYWSLLEEKYSVSFDDEQLKSKWSTKVLTEIGKVLLTTMHQVILLDWDYLENNKKTEIDKHNKKNLLSPFLLNVREFNGVEKTEIRGNLSAWQYCSLLNAGEFKLNTFELPMMSPPVPWNSVGSGGYLLNHRFSQKSLLRNNEPKQQQHLRQTSVQNLYPVFDSLNHLAETPWKINQKVLNTVTEVFNTWDNNALDGFTSYQTEENKQIAKLLFGTNNAKDISSAIYYWLKKVSLANELRDDVFWLPHNADHRGRQYVMAGFLNYQWSDVDRGLLQFAKSKPLSTTGLDSLKVHLTTLLGARKKSTIKDKIEFCDEQLPQIMDSADNPLTGAGWWKNSSKPWQTLACCVELTSALRAEDPQKFISHFPVHQDGFCNGLQHLAALGRDEETAKHVNLVPNELPNDLYTKIADQVEQIRQEDAKRGHRVAKCLAGMINRQFLKTPIMMMVYALNLEGPIFSITTKLGENGNFPYELRQKGAEYITNKMVTLFNAQFPRVGEIKSWFIECGKLISQVHSGPVNWVSPIGLPIRQVYFDIGTSHGFRPVTKGFNTMKQSSGFWSNFIHSLDASHASLTNLHCRRRGITFASIHDSFWTHPSSVAEMNKICREQFIALHSEPILENLSQHLNQQFCNNDETSHEQVINLKEIISKTPSKGTFDLKNVLNATHFFS